ncbi:PBECR2 nuclease fold domain-containing protein [Clostridioides difficile]|nr:PBECR2 nuclease fold domain-containing protein [Clostridioides difficile]
MSTDKVVGIIDEELAELAGIKYTGKIYASSGVIKHIKKKHRGQLSKNIFNDILETIKIVLKSPEYIGSHPKKPGKSVEFVKKLDDYILVATELDTKKGYLYVSSLYAIKEAKLESRISSGRVLQYDG